MSSRKRRRERREARDAPLPGAPSPAKASTRKRKGPTAAPKRSGEGGHADARGKRDRRGGSATGRRSAPASPPPRAPTQDLPDRWTPSVKPLVAPLTALLDERYRPARAPDLPLAELHADALRRLSEHFTHKRHERRAGYLSTPAARAAYLLYYSLTGAATVQAALALAGQRAPFAWERLESGDTATSAAPPAPLAPLRVLDLGAGPLTASLGVALRWPDRALDVTAVDGSRAALRDGATLLRAIRPEAQVRLLDGNLRDGALRNQLGGGYDLVVVANVLNEFREQVRRRGTEDVPDHQRSPAERVLLDALTRLAPGGRVLVLEPAARGPSRLLIALRDRLTAHGNARVLAPCLDTPTCPLGDVRNRDWCHAEHPWRRPFLVKTCDRVLRHKRDTLKFSYLWLAAPSEGPPAAAPGSYRVIGGPMGQRPVRRYLCGPGGRVTAVLHDPRKPDAARVSTAVRGDLVVLAGTPQQGGPRREWQLSLGRSRPQGARS